MLGKETTAKARSKAKNEVVAAYKGFDENLACRGFQYEIGKSYSHEGEVEICSTGFHACEMPLDAWTYYGPVTSRFCAVELSGKMARHDGKDSKIAAAEISIKAELQLPDMIRAAVTWVLDRAKGNTATGYSGHAAATGDYGHAAATGYSGHAAATGYSGHAAATGYSGHAAATGDYGHAAATGDDGHAAATGNSGHAAATGDYGHAAATGYSGHAAATGYSGHAAATGDYGHAAATGNSGHAAATGDYGHAAATGYSGHAAATGNSGHAAATGNSGHAAVKGQNAIAAALGIGSLATAGPIGSAIMLAEYDRNYKLIAVFAGMVGTNGIEPEKTYRLKAGKPVEVA